MTINRKKMKISLTLPTRGRPNNMENVFNTAKETISSDNEFEIIYYLDEDDLVSINKAKEMSSKNEQVLFFIGKRQVLSNCWNDAYKLSTGEIIGFIDDETRFITNEWDKKILSVFNNFKDKICFVGGNDNYYNKRWGKNFCTLGFLHRNWVDTIGYFVPPYFVADYCDTWLNDVAKQIDRHFWLEDLQIHHLHRETEYGLDKTHEERLLRARKYNPKGLYYSNEMKRKRSIDCFKLQTYITNYKSKETK